MFGYSPYFNMSYMLMVLVPTVILTMLAQWRVRSAFARWSQVPNERGLTGVDTARMIMQRTGLDHIEVRRTPGELTDFYDPRSKSINLSDSSTGAPSVAAMAVVAHELGHAEQDQVGDAMLNLRASLVPTAQLGSNLAPWLIILGLWLGVSRPLGGTIAGLGILLFGAAVLFSFVTLPVEFDASRRAKKHLRELGLISPHEESGVGAVLDAAALTYVAAAAVSLLNLLYWVTQISDRRRS